MTSSRSKPSRVTGVISRSVGSGFVLIEPVTQTAHALEGLHAAVWRSLEDGTTPAAPTHEVDQVLAELAELGLVTESTPGFSRRSVLKKSGLVVAGAGVVTIALPPSIAAASPVFNFAAGKTTPGPIFIQVPANPGALRDLTVTLVGGSGGPGNGATGTNGIGRGGGSISFTIRQPAAGVAFTLLGYVGGGGRSSGNGATGGVSAAASPGTFSAAGGVGGTSGNRDAGGGGAATYITDSAGALIAVAGGGGGGGGDSLNGGDGGAGGLGANSVANTASTTSTGGLGANGTDNTGGGSTYFGSAGAAATTVRNGGNNVARNVGTGGAGGPNGTVLGTAGSNGTATATSGAGGAGGNYGMNNAGSGGGGGGGYAGGGGGGAGSAAGGADGSGAGGGGGSDFLATAASFTGFSILAQTATGGVGANSGVTGNGPDGSMSITG